MHMVTECSECGDMFFHPRDDMGHVGCDMDPYHTPLHPFWIDIPL